MTKISKLKFCQTISNLKITVFINFINAKAHIQKFPYAEIHITKQKYAAEKHNGQQPHNTQKFRQMPRKTSMWGNPTREREREILLLCFRKVQNSNKPTFPAKENTSQHQI
jgi:hypothetical protein